MAGRRVRPPPVVAVASLADTNDHATDRVMIQAEQNLQDLQDGSRRTNKTVTAQGTTISSHTTSIASLGTRMTTAETNITTLQGEVSGRLLARQIFTASGPYTKTAGAVRAIVRMSGAGGGGGGATSIANSSVGGGGASGVSIEFMLGPDGASIGPLASGTVTIGAAGTAGTTAPTAGGTGGDASLTIGATTYIAKGGGGGAAGSMSGVGTASGGRPQAGSTSGAGVTQAADIGLNGLLVDNSGNGQQGAGGTSPYGFSNLAASVGTQPAQASGYGAGGAGGVCSGVSSCAGGQGAPPIIFIDEYS